MALDFGSANKMLTTIAEPVTFGETLQTLQLDSQISNIASAGLDLVLAGRLAPGRDRTEVKDGSPIQLVGAPAGF